MPETAAGTTIRRLVARAARPEPERRFAEPCGTACIASSEIDATSGIGQDADPDARPPARLKSGALRTAAWITFGLMTVSAKKPRTTLGMPARISRIGFSRRRIRGEAYSDR